MQGPPYGPVWPAQQSVTVTHAEKDELPVGEAVLARHARQGMELAEATTMEYSPTPHAVHGAEPVVSLYDPAAHGVHGPPIGPVLPTLQTSTIHTSLDVLEAGETHAVHGPPLGPV